MAGRVNPASLLSLDELFTTESERTSNKEESQPEKPKTALRGKIEEPRERASEQTVKKRRRQKVRAGTWPAVGKTFKGAVNNW